MSANIDTHRVQEFANTVQLLLQQKGSKLKQAVMSGRHIGKQASPVDQIDAIAAQKVTGRFQAIGRVDAEFDRRWVFPVDYDLNQLLDSFDQLRLLNDPRSSYVQNAVFAMGRAMDDEIIAAFFGTAKTGEAAGTSTSYDTGNTVAVDTGAAAATGLNVPKLRAAKKILMANQVDLESDPIYCVITAEQHDDLLAEVQIISSDFNGADRPVLMDGRVQRFLGINFIHCERIGVDASSYRRCPVFAKSGMYLGTWNELHTDVSQRKDLTGHPWQAYLYATFGATRLDEKKVCEIKCSE